MYSRRAYASHERFYHLLCNCCVNSCTTACVLAGYADKELLLDCNDMGIKLQPESSPPLLHRAFGYGIDMRRPVDTFRWLSERSSGAVGHWRCFGCALCLLLPEMYCLRSFLLMLHHS